MRDLWRTLWKWGRIYYECFGFSLLLSFHKLFKIVFIHIVLLSQEKRAKPGNLQIEECCFICTETLARKMPSYGRCFNEIYHVLFCLVNDSINLAEMEPLYSET